MRGKIIKGIAGFYYVHDGIGSIYECKAKGIFRNRKIKPLVGDDVEITVLSEQEKTGNIDRILERKNQLIRPAVSNVDQAVVVFAITEPMPNLNLLDRFLVMMERQKVPVMICFNKIDLAGQEEVDKLGVESTGTVTVDYQVGDNVEITAGPLQGFIGLVEHLDLTAQKVQVKVSMFGRETPAELELNQVKPL